MSTDEFARMIDEDELLDWAIVYNDYKGIPKQQVREALATHPKFKAFAGVEGKDLAISTRVFTRSACSAK